MKRYGNLIEQIAELENIRYAFYLAAKGRHKKQIVQEWLARNCEPDFLKIRNELLNCSIKVGNYHHFKVFEPKERLIYAAAFEERILQHAIMRVCAPIFDKFLIADSYACRVGKGQYKALEKAIENHKKTRWFIKMDVRKYFDSINHKILKSLLQKRFKDRCVLDAFDKIIDSYSVYIDSDSSTTTGLPIGNLTSQYFANYFLSFSDRFIKEELKIKYYVRYMDDMVIWVNNIDTLQAIFQQIEQFLNDILNLNLKPAIINRTEHGLSFLGYRITKNTLTLTNASRKRYVNKKKLYQYLLYNESWTEKDYQRHFVPLSAFVNHTRHHL